MGPACSGSTHAAGGEALPSESSRPVWAGTGAERGAWTVRPLNMTVGTATDRTQGERGLVSLVPGGLGKSLPPPEALHL